MADSLVLTGSRQVTKHAGDEMQRHDSPRGGNTWKIPRWWQKGNGTVYTDCTVFKVSAGGNTTHLAIESSSSLNLRIDHDGAFGFTFSQFNEVSRAALYTSDWKLIEHYVFPSISRGKVMTVVPADAIGKPGGGGGGVDPTPDVVVTIDSVNGTDGYILSGDATGENATINVTIGEVLSITNNTGSHPLYIKSSLGSGNSGQINDGSVTGQGATSGAVVWDTNEVAAGTYYYQCQLHEAMAGEIIVA